MRSLRMERILPATMALVCMTPWIAVAQTADELAKQTQNPVASLISVPLQGNWDFGLGDREATATLLNIQPVMPFAVSTNMNVILRVIMPMTSQPGPDGTRVNGMGDILTTAFFASSKPSKIVLGVGPAILLPTATNSSIGTEKFAIGPSVVARVPPGKWTVGVLFNQLWSTSGAIDRSDVNQTFLQPFVNYNLGHGLSVGATSEATGNWEAEQAWTAPLLFNVSKVTLLGKRPVSFVAAAGPTIASPDGGASWRFRLGVTFLFPR